MSKRPAPALAELSEDRPVESFEQLDTALSIVSIPDWLLLGVLFATVLGFAGFSCLYRAPLKVEGRGIILEKRNGAGDEALLQVTAPAAGRLTRVNVNVGDMVKKGAVLATIDQSLLGDQIIQATADVARLREEHKRLTALDQGAARERQLALDELKRTLEENLKNDRNRLADARIVAQVDERLKRQGKLTRNDALATLSAADQIASAVGAAEARLKELEFLRIEDQSARDKEKEKRLLGIEAAEKKLEILQGQFDRDTQIKSPYEGRVTDLMLTPHALIEKGAPAALLQPERTDEPLEATVFVPAGLGKKIRVGSDVEISPDTVRRHEHGYVRGEVLSISEIPATELEMVAELKHKTLVTSFLEQYAGQVLLRIRVKLHDVRDSGFTFKPGDKKPANFLVWSSSSGSRQFVTSGTLCSASVVVDRRRLIALAVPWVKQLVGIY